MRKWLIKIWTEDLLPLYQHSKYLYWFLAFTIAMVGGIWTVVLLVYFRLQKWLNIYLEYFIKEDASGSKRFLSLKLDCLWRLLNKAEFRYICFEKTNVCQFNVQKKKTNVDSAVSSSLGDIRLLDLWLSLFSDWLQIQNGNIQSPSTRKAKYWIQGFQFVGKPWS